MIHQHHCNASRGQLAVERQTMTMKVWSEESQYRRTNSSINVTVAMRLPMRDLHLARLIWTSDVDACYDLQISLIASSC